MEHTCTSCGCCWDETGFYVYRGEIVQPCRECRKDSKSIYYWNNQHAILEAQRQAYYADHEARKAYFRNYRQQRRAQALA